MGWGGVGWGGVGMMTFLELAHMVDATQLCLSCHCTHGGCYATLFVLSLHTWWMLRNSVCLVIAHMVDATQLCEKKLLQTNLDIQFELSSSR